MQRKNFLHNDLTLSWLDGGGDGPLLIALHAHYGWRRRHSAVSQQTLSESGELQPSINAATAIPVQAATYTRRDYISDLEGFFAELRVSAPVVLLGNSLGGINALQFAAKHPDLVQALILEDIAVEVDTDIGFVRAWSGDFQTRDALAERIGSRLLPYLEDSFRESPDGWRLAFDPEDMVRSQESLKGRYWDEWLYTTRPALIIRGRDSRVTTLGQVGGDGASPSQALFSLNWKAATSCIKTAPTPSPRNSDLFLNRWSRASRIPGDADAFFRLMHSG